MWLCFIIVVSTSAGQQLRATTSRVAVIDADG
jgi:hypothetical protein